MTASQLGAIFLVVAVATGCERQSENAGSASGPGVDVDCALKRRDAGLTVPLLPGQGVGNTKVDVQC